jgi:Ser/Thr protein kinase RdoA (MazF antagonist)
MTATALDLTPYAGLTPHAVIDALEACGLRCDGRLLQLNSYENRVFQVGLDDGRFVVAKFYRAGRWSDAQILEEHAFALELQEAEVPAVAPLILPFEGAAVEPTVRLLGTPATLAVVGPWRLAVAPRCGGRAPELEQPAVLQRIGSFIGRLHGVGQRGRFDHRLRLDGTRIAREAVEWLEGTDRIPPESRGEWLNSAGAALRLAQERFDEIGTVTTLRLHGDCHLGNLLWTDQGAHFVDLDDCLSGPAIQDLWMLLGGDRLEMSQQMGAVLQGYEAFRDFDDRELALIEPLRTLRLVQHSVWIARRWDDPAFPIAFPNFASPSYWSQQATQLREQLEAMSEPAIRRG